jgi:hypothetical protein
MGRDGSGLLLPEGGGAAVFRGGGGYFLLVLLPGLNVRGETEKAERRVEEE